MKVTAETITDNQIRILRLALRSEIEELIGLTHSCADAIARKDDHGARAMLADAWNARDNADLARPQHSAFKPRAVAVLVALRRGSLTTMQIRNAIADETTEPTRLLLRDMASESLVRERDARWWVREAGVAYLETNGLTVDDEARL